MASIAPLQFYVYVLCRPNGKPFYVGKGKGKRLFDHDREARKGCSCKKCNTIRKIWRNGGAVQYYIVFETNDEQAAYDYECATIALHGRNNLCNLSDGGLGLNGYVPSAKTRKLLSLHIKEPGPCHHCGRIYKPLRRGLCAACSQYQRTHGQMRPLDLVEKFTENTPPPVPDGMKWCPVCCVVKSVSDYYIDAGRPAPRCKECHKHQVHERDKARYYADLEKARTYNREKSRRLRAAKASEMSK